MFLATLVFLGGWQRVPAQPPATRPIRVDVGLVLVNIAIFDTQQRPIADFQRADLEILEDGVRQQIAYFGRDDLPLNLALVLDVSGSVIPVLPQIKEAAYDALSMLKPADAVALFAFARRVRNVVNYTTDREQISEGISGLRAGGGTALNDALYVSSQSLQQLPRDRRRVIVMISDNEGMPVNDHSEREAIVESQESGAVVYGIQIQGRGDPMHWAIPADILSKRLLKTFRQSGDMKKFAAETGGVVISSGKARGIRNAFSELMLRVAAQYYAGYFSSNPRQDGKLRKIEVNLSKEGRKHLGKVKIDHRRAYIAPVAVTEGEPPSIQHFPKPDR